MEPITLDENICYYVLIPIFIVCIMVSFLRQKILVVLKSDTKVDLKEVKNSQLLTRAKVLRVNADFLPEKAFRSRKAFFNKKDTGAFWNPPDTPNPLQAMATQDPTQVMGMLKSQMAFVILNGGLAYWVHFLFSGFLVAKAPFPLTYKFKFMLQRGVDLSSLDVTYVSSLSWYFFILFASGGIVSLLLNLRGAPQHEQEAQDIQAMDMINPMMGGMAGPTAMPGMPGSQPDLKKVYQQERDNLDIVSHDFALATVEQRLVQKWTKQKQH
ncbi:unnamed protein product [Vitrella brassicaformis CCMP3155]|uniref:ER membrane protein complex subunit 3 n=2 Tax=Vitrella brassicaformis TaxID=1169539 RepID=A0A0G4EEZ5_VITBC|nr:unnamed protein product [Vitrella brassicaformis CCMP3155]|mmetsp:Transcript_45722/g.113601  ORF Transcript_45722/g.113601 Transcript_45722/m.113601 type:complete len:269 (+) Transcript_45722:60-866(+)|eukprot:CEL93961.1 unnamed protein product [Vitrella brassicaformis CCMP3155]